MRVRTLGHRAGVLGVWHAEADLCDLRGGPRLMARAQAFDFAAPAADVQRVGPTGEPLPPIAGTTPQSRHASYTGAVHAAETRTANIVALRQLWREPRTMQEMATITGLPLSSICSLKAAMADELEFIDFEEISWGLGRKATKRSRWRVKANR